jgi:simple sugar transport system substrate-binding protein
MSAVGAWPTKEVMMSRIHPRVEEALDTVPLNPVSRRRLLQGAGLFSASMAA